MIANSNSITAIEQYATFKVRPLFVHMGGCAYHALVGLPFFIVLLVISFISHKGINILLLLASLALAILFLSAASMVLGYWLLFNIALFLILIGVWFKLRRKEKFRRRVERLLPIPIAYGLGHLCVMGFRTASCSEWRDFQLILAVGVLFYCAMLLALSIFYNVKELRGIKREGENE